MKRISPQFWQSGIVLLIVVGAILLALGGYLSPIFKTATSPVVALQSYFSTRYSALVQFLTAPRDMAALNATNQELENQVASLQGQVVELQQKMQDYQAFSSLLDFARSRPENSYVGSTVIGKDTNPFLRYIYIDHGSDDGIRHGMPVVTHQGLVGRIDAVTATAARVQLITDAGSQVNIRLSSDQTEAMLSGSITGDVSIQMVPQDVKLKTGDLVLTSGLGGSYPANVVIGQIISIRKRDTDLFQSAAVQPAVDFNSLRAVLVITNFQPIDISPLVPSPAP